MVKITIIDCLCYNEPLAKRASRLFLVGQGAIF